MGTKFQKIRELNEFEGKSYRTFSTGKRDMKATMVKKWIGQLKLMIYRVLNVLNNSDLGTYMTFLDAILNAIMKVLICNWELVEHLSMFTGSCCSQKFLV